MAKVIKVDIVIVNMSSVFSLLQPSKKTSTKVAIDGINNGGLKVDRGLKVGLSSASRAAAAVPCCGLTANILSHSKQLGRLTRKLASPIVSRKSSLVAASSQAHKLTTWQGKLLLRCLGFTSGSAVSRSELS